MKNSTEYTLRFIPSQLKKIAFNNKEHQNKVNYLAKLMQFHRWQQLKTIGYFLCFICIVQISWLTKPNSNHQNNNSGNILVIGTPRSGATPLAVALQQALGGNPNVNLEINPKKLSNIFKPGDKYNVVKTSIASRQQYQNPSLENIVKNSHKTIIVVRDPRDVIISTMLHQMSHYHFVENRSAYKKFLDKIRYKQQHPHKISLFELLQLQQQLETEHASISSRIMDWHDIALDYQLVMNLAKKYKNKVFVLRYEDWLANKHGNLNDYIGVNINIPDQVSVAAMGLDNQPRSGLYGDWKNWFTINDLKEFYPKFAQTMNFFNYSHDWQLAVNPTIDTAQSSEYIISVTANNPHIFKKLINNQNST